MLCSFLNQGIITEADSQPVVAEKDGFRYNLYEKLAFDRRVDDDGRV